MLSSTPCGQVALGEPSPMTLPQWKSFHESTSVCGEMMAYSRGSTRCYAWNCEYKKDEMPNPQ